MSLSIAVKVSEGLVMASDSRITVARPREGGLPDLMLVDSASKLWPLGAPNPTVTVGLYGTATTALRSLRELVLEFGAAQGEPRPVQGLALGLHELLVKAGLSNVGLLVGGYDADSAFSRLYHVGNPGEVVELFGRSSKGVAFGGQRELAENIHKQLNPPLEQMGLMQAKAYARFLIETARDAQAFTLGMPGIGGEVQLATIERRNRVRME